MNSLNFNFYSKEVRKIFSNNYLEIKKKILLLIIYLEIKFNKNLNNISKLEMEFNNYQLRKKILDSLK